MPTDHVWRQSTIYQAFKNESSKQNIFLIETCGTNVFHEIFQIRYPNKMRPSSRLVGHIRHMSSLYSCLTLGVHTFCTIENLHRLQRQTQIQNRNNAMFVNSKCFTGRLAWKLKESQWPLCPRTGSKLGKVSREKKVAVLLDFVKWRGGGSPRGGPCPNLLSPFHKCIFGE